MIKKILIFNLFVILFCCDISNKKLFLINNSNDTIYYRLLTHTKLYNDLYLYKASPKDSIMPDFVMGIGKGVWEYKINHKSNDSTLNIFIFHSGLLNDSIINNRIYDWRGFKVKDLEKLKWVVTYPNDFK